MIYEVARDDNVVYIKVDDDVVYIAPQTVAELVAEKLRNRCVFVSANVINHAVLAALHQDIGAVRPFAPDVPVDGSDCDPSVTGGLCRLAPEPRPPGSGWKVAKPGFVPYVIQRHAQGECVWESWECGAWMHESFLSRLEDRTECAYDFGWHNFHSNGFGGYKAGRPTPLPYTRWSINVFAFVPSDLDHSDAENLVGDDESEVSYAIPMRSGKPACAVGKALVAHYSYSKQEDGSACF
jgi:hypothetical protein